MLLCFVNKVNMALSLLQIKHNDAMEPGMRIHLPVSVAEGEVKKRYETIPTATLHPNKDEIEYLRRLVIHRVILFVGCIANFSWTYIGYMTPALIEKMLFSVDNWPLYVSIPQIGHIVNK